VFITASPFTKEARDYAASLQVPRLSLSAGLELARLMIAHDLGVILEQRFDVKGADSDYFGQA
jgi:restriction system protein